MMAGEIEGLAVYQADANPRVAGRTPRNRRRRIVSPGLAAARYGVEDRFVRKRELVIVTIHHVDPRRQAAPEGMILSPHRVRPQRIVIAGQQKHRPVGPLAALEQPQQLAPPSLRGNRLMKEVARA